jgi:hypothetical protein
VRRHCIIKAIVVLIAFCITLCAVNYSLKKSAISSPISPITEYHQSVIHALDDPEYHRSAPLAVHTEHTFSFKEIRFKKREKIPDTALDITIDIILPAIHAPNQTQAAFNQSIYTYAKTVLHKFFNSLPTPEESKEAYKSGRNVHYDCSISYQVYYATDTFLSVRLYTYNYTGGAHGAHDYTSITYNLHTGQKVELPDLYSQQNLLLDTLATYCARELTRCNRQEQFTNSTYITAGTVAKPEHYTIWNITPDGLLITYKHNQVAPYCAGMQQVLVPYTHFKQDTSSLMYTLAQHR